MNFQDIILAKRYGRKLTNEQIRFFVDAVTDRSVPDYQISALLMAIVLNGMDDEETTSLALFMAESGKTVNLSAIPGKKVDKHSTGGVGDKCTPILLALVSSFDIPVAKLSGRGLGFTGGTIDKFESICGFHTEIPIEEFPSQIEKVGMVLSGQTPDLAPADKVLYALRDVTGTVDSIPLIASSIMSKKLAGGADAIVLNVTYGNGAFMKNKTDAVALAEKMIRIGHLSKRKVTCVLSPMNQPLGLAVGNILEMQEVMNTLKGFGTDDLLDICIRLAVEMILLSDKAADHQPDSLRSLCEKKIRSGSAWKKFSQFIVAQGGEVDEYGDPVFCDIPTEVDVVRSGRKGYVESISAEHVGRASVMLGAGRREQKDKIDYGAGIVFSKKVGDAVDFGDKICAIFMGQSHPKDSSRVAQAIEILEAGIVISSDPVLSAEDEIVVIK